MNRAGPLDFVQFALECTLYLSPTDPGLTNEELFEVGKRLGFERGEIGDVSAGAAGPMYFGDKYLRPRPNPLWAYFNNITQEIDYRDIASFDFVWGELKELVKLHGRASAKIERGTLVQRGVARGLARLNVEAALTISVYARHLVAKDEVVRFVEGKETYPLPGAQLRGAIRSTYVDEARDELRKKTYAAVRDIIARRADGRPSAVEPLEAFAEKLDALGYGKFRLWWTQSVAELKLLDPMHTPVAATVASAALVEGALTFVVKHARTSGVGPLKSKDFDEPPNKWKIDDLVKSAAMGQDSAILDPSAKHRADQLVKTRQRIHAGRMLVDFPTGVPDLRPEEAKDARATAELVVRKILDWLERFPVGATPGGSP